jgi:hypothetical protein
VLKHCSIVPEMSAKLQSFAHVVGIVLMRAYNFARAALGRIACVYDGGHILK